MNAQNVSDQPINQHANSLLAPHLIHQRPARPRRFCSFSSQDLIQLLAAAGNDAVATELKQIAAVLFCTGIRPGELKSLTWSDVDMEKRSLRVGSKSGERRTVPFGHKVLQILVDRAKVNAGAQYVLGKSPTTTLSRILRRLHALPRTADRRKLTLYCLRHSFATRWVVAGGSLVALRAIMGFSSSLPIKSFLSQDCVHADARRFQAQLEEENAL
jgi:integrase